MNATRTLNEIRKDAMKAHELAQNTGIADLYTTAAELYEKVGDWDMARVCRDAAQILRQAEETA